MLSPVQSVYEQFLIFSFGYGHLEAVLARSLRGVDDQDGVRQLWECWLGERDSFKARVRNFLAQEFPWESQRWCDAICNVVMAPIKENLDRAEGLLTHQWELEREIATQSAAGFPLAHAMPKLQV